MDDNQVHKIPQENWFLRVDTSSGRDWRDTEEQDYEKAKEAAKPIYEAYRRSHGAVLMHHTDRRAVLFDKDSRDFSCI